VALRVDTPPTSASGELGVFPSSNRNAGFAIELIELLQHHRACGHIDSQRQGFGGKDNFQKFSAEELFHHFLKHGQHSGMVSRYTAENSIKPFVVPQHVAIIVIESFAPILDKIENLVPLILFSESYSSPQDLVNRLVAAFSGKNEENSWQ